MVAMSAAASESRLNQLGFRFRAYRRLPDENWTRPETTPWVRDHFRAAFVDSIPAQVLDVLEALGTEPTDLVLTDSLLSGPGLAAERAGVGWASYITFYMDEARLADDSFRTWWDQRRREAGLPPDPRPLDESAWVGLSRQLCLVVGLPELVPEPAALPPYVRRIGPVVWDPPTGTGAPEWLPGFGRERPGVLVSTSSAWLDDADLVTKTSEGLADSQVDLVATVPTEHALPALAPNVILTSYCPHGLIIPKVKAVVCSAGFGLVTRALCAGVPLVMVPRGGEAQLVALAVAQAGAGIALDPRRITPGGIRSAVTCVLKQPSYRYHAERFRVAARRYRASTTAARLIERLCLSSDRDPPT